MSGNTAVLMQRADPWRWMILFSRFLVAFLVVGNFKSMGVFLPHIEDGFDTATAPAGFVIGSSLGFGFVCIGPFFGTLTKVWSLRRIAIVGGFIAATCVLAAAFSSSFVLFATLISISSVGLGVSSIAVTLPLVEYFPEDFAIANGVSLAGGAVGMMVLPPVMEFLLSLYGWRSALWLMAAFSFNFLVCGALLRPCRSLQEDYRPLGHHSNTQTETLTATHSDDCSKTRDHGKGSVLQTLQKLFDTELLARPMFFVYQVLSLFVGLFFSMWHLFLIPLGIQLGHGETQAAFLATFAGVGNLIGRVGHGYPIDRKLLRTSSVFLAATLLFAASNLGTLSVGSSYAALATLSAVSGIAMGTIYPITFVLTLEVFPDKSDAAFGWLLSSFGTGIMMGGFSAGCIHDYGDDYNIVFVTLGALSVVMAAILVLIRYFQDPNVKS